MSKRKTRHIIAGRVNGKALVINTNTMKYLFCHDNAMDSVKSIGSGDLTHGCDVTDLEDLEELKCYIKEGVRILI